MGLLEGDYENEQVKAILASTETQNIAKAIGFSEDEIALDWEDFLNKEQIEKIQGHF